MRLAQKVKILDLLKQGLDSKVIALQEGVTVQQVAAIKAHVTMGTYSSTQSRSPYKVLTPNSATNHGDREHVPSKSRIDLNRAVDGLEKAVRDRIDCVLSKASENYLELIPSDVALSIDRKINERLKRHPYEKKSNTSNRQKLDYMDFMDYCKVILANWNYFESEFGSKSELEKYFLNVKEVRNALKHLRELNSVEYKQGEASIEWLSLILQSHGADLGQVSVPQKREFESKSAFRHTETAIPLAPKGAFSTNRETHFNEAMLSIYRQAKTECKYNAVRFLQMLDERGGLQTAKHLLHTTGLSDGFVALWKCNRLDLTVEAFVLKTEWRELFSEEELAIAKKRLLEVGYSP